MDPSIIRSKQEIGVGLLGIGGIGSRVADVILNHEDQLYSHSHPRFVIKKALVKNSNKKRSIPLVDDLITTDPDELVSADDIDIIIEVMGGEHPAYELIASALRNGKHVVSANKEVIAKRGADLIRIAQENNVHIFFEASVGGGIPVINSLTKDFQGERISSIRSIINGTTNYILTNMGFLGKTFPQALEEAQNLGYAEPDPSNDINGMDAAYKITIIANIAFSTRISMDDVYYEGINKIQTQDFNYASELGYSIKLLAIAKRLGNNVEIRVHPVLLSKESLLARVDYDFNAVEINGELVGKVLLHGLGAGSGPTTSAIMSDLHKTVTTPVVEQQFELNRSMVGAGNDYEIKSITDLETKYYIRMTVEDEVGVLANIAGIFGKNNISIESVIQKNFDNDINVAEIVIMTHVALEKDIQESLEQLKNLKPIKSIDNFIRVEEQGS